MKNSALFWHILVEYFPSSKLTVESLLDKKKLNISTEMALCNTAEVPKCLINGKNIVLFFFKGFFDSITYLIASST